MTGDAGPTSTRPEGNPDLSMAGDGPPVGDSPLADAPMPEAPALAPDSTEPAAEADEELSAAATDEVEVAPDQASSESEPVAPPPPPEPRLLSRAERENYDRLRQRYAACGRCGYFLADLELLFGREAIQAAALDARDGWLRLEGDEALRPLLIHAYGVGLDRGYDYLDGSCPECRRRFVYRVEDSRTRLKVRT